MVVGEFTSEVDLVIIGAGPGGYVAALRAAQLGKSVTLIEQAELGGVCLNRGCIPSKVLISAAKRYEQIKSPGAEIQGLTVEGAKIDFRKVQAWKQSIIDKLTGGIEGLLTRKKVEVIQGEALFISQNEVRVLHGYERQGYTFKQCIIATGSHPIELKEFPFGQRILSSTEVLQLTEIPKSIVVLGGGYIGVELGQMLAKLGTQVTILEGGEQILPAFEKEIIRLVEQSLEHSGVRIRTRAMARGFEEKEDGVKVVYSIGGEEKEVEAEYLLVTVGRKPNIQDLGLDKTQVQVNTRGFIEINEQCQTSNPNIFAIGDVVEGPALAHKAAYEGKVAAEVIAGKASAIDYKVIPSVVFSDPELATVGLTKKEARNQGYQVVLGKYPFAANGRALSLHSGVGYVQLVAEKSTGLLLGAQIIGPEASNLIAELTLAIELGATLEDIALTIHAHPTLGEIIMEAAEMALG